MKTITVGTKVEDNWGAMFPPIKGVVIAICDGTATSLATIKWDDASGLQVVNVNDIHQPGWTSVNGSPLGIFVRA